MGCNSSKPSSAGVTQPQYCLASKSRAADLTAAARCLGRRAEFVEESSHIPGLHYDQSMKGWDINMAKDGVYPPVSEEKKSWTSPDGAKALIPKEFDIDNMFPGVARSFRVGLYDERAKRIDASTSFELAVGADGKLSGAADLKLRTLVGNGQRQIAYEYCLPCARLMHSSHVEHKNFSWVREVYLGARIEGLLSVTFFQSGMTQANASLSTQVDLNTGSAAVGGGVGFQSSSPPKCVSNRLTQHGGLRLSCADWESKDLCQIFHYLDKRWTEETLQRADAWQILMIKVEEGKHDEIHMMSPHTIVLGRAGTGKSSFFNAMLGGRRDCTGREHFLTSRGEEDEGKSCTRKPCSQVHQLDAIAGDSNGDAHEVSTTFRFTDVPGFGAKDLPDSSILADLFLKLGTPECRRLHAIVWVERYDETKFNADHLQALVTLEEHFGPKLWDLMAVVLTSFPFPAKESEEKAMQEANELKRKRAQAMKQRIIELMPSAKDVWGDRQNMFFCVDSLDAVLTEEELKVMDDEEKNLPEDDPLRGRAQQKRRSRDFAQTQFRSLKLHMVANTRNNLFWDSCAHQDVVYNPPDNVIHLSQLTHLHSFKMTTFYAPTWCDQCETMLWGVNNQGQRCSDPQCSLTLCHLCAGESQSTYAGSSCRLTAGSFASAGAASARSPSVAS